MAAIFFAFALPQFYALVFLDNTLSQDALTRMLEMSFLCLLMCHLGYKIGAKSEPLNFVNIHRDHKKLRIIAFFYFALGIFCHCMLKVTDIQTNEYGQWTGIATVYAFFSQALFVCISVYLNEILKPKGWQSLPKTGILLIISYVTILMTEVLSGRRENTAMIIILLATALFFQRKRMVSRAAVALALVLFPFVIPLFGMFRKKGLWWMLFSGTIRIPELMNALGTVTHGTVLELRNAALLMDASISQNTFGLGRGVWDALVFQFIPSQWLGKAFKSALMFNATSFDLVSLYGYSYPVGSTPTGVGDSFCEFGYFGCLWFALMAYFGRKLWISAVFQNHLARIFYPLFVTCSLICLTHGINRFAAEMGTYIFFFAILVFFSRDRRQNIRVGIR